MPDRPEPREVVIVTAGGALTDDDVAQVRRAYEAKA